MNCIVLIVFFLTNNQANNKIGCCHPRNTVFFKMPYKRIQLKELDLLMFSRYSQHSPPQGFRKCRTNDSLHHHHGTVLLALLLEIGKCPGENQLLPALSMNKCVIFP